MSHSGSIAVGPGVHYDLNRDPASSLVPADWCIWPQPAGLVKGSTDVTLLSNSTGELLSGRIRKGRPQAHRLSTPVRTRQRPDCRPEEMNQNNGSVICLEEKGEKHFFSFYRKCLGEHGPCFEGQHLLSLFLDTWIIPHFPTKPPWHWLSGLSNGSLRKHLLSLPAEDPAFLHLFGCQGTGVHGWCNPRHERHLPGEAAARDLLSKAMQVAVGPRAGLEEASTLLVLIPGCLGSEYLSPQRIKT